MAALRGYLIIQVNDIPALDMFMGANKLVALEK
jgi:hypothetical protein